MVMSDIVGGNGPRRSSRLILAAASVSAALISSTADAKHPNISLPGSSCSEPEAFIRRQVAKIKDLRQPGQTSQNEAPKTVAEFFARMENKPDADPGSETKITELRQQADGFNALLKAEGCKTVDIDAELDKPQVATDGRRKDK